MPSNDSQADLNEAPDDLDKAVAAALSNPQLESGMREAADLEEKIAAQKISEARANGEDASPVESSQLAAVAAKGRDHLLERMRDHARKTAANKEAYVPPPITEAQKTKRDEELEAGRRAQAKHQAQWDSRPVPKRDPTEGVATPVFRPGDVVPDPVLTAGNFAAGTRKFGPDV